MVDVESCGRPGLKGWICDADGLVPRESLDVIEGSLRAIHDGKPTSCDDREARWQVAVAVAKSIEGPASDAPERTAEFAQKVHNAWGVGDACGNGVLLVLNIGDRQMYISSGTAALQHLFPARVDGIRERMRPALRAGSYGTALEQAVVEIGLYLTEDPVARPSGDGWLFGCIAAMFAGIWGIQWWHRGAERRSFKTVQTKLQKMQQDLRDAKANKYVATSCPICLDDFDGSSSSGASAPVAESRAAAPESAPLLPGDGASTSAAAGLDPMPDAPDKDVETGEKEARAGAIAASAPKQTRTPFLLSCGHTFCEPCIMKWLETNTACPVCRKPADGRAPPPADDRRPSPGPPADDGEAPRPGSPRHRPSCQQRSFNNRPHLNEALFLDEFAFRMAMMRRSFPQFITPAMEHDMVAQAAEGGDLNWAQHRDFLARDPVVRAERERVGGTSSSISFGGGRSGGGSGGGW